MSEKSDPRPIMQSSPGPAPVRMVGLPQAVGLGPVNMAPTANTNSASESARMAQERPAERAEARHDGPPAPEDVALRPRPDAQEPKTQLGGDLGGMGKGGGGGGGGGRGRGGGIEQRLGDRDFKQVLGVGLSDARRNLVIVGIFSIVVNTLVLAVPIYLFQMSDRVLTSRSLDTLVMLSIIVMVAIAAHVLLDMVRRFILMRVAVDVESRLGGPVLAAAAKAAQTGSNREFQTLADLQQIRSFLTGPVILTMLDAPTAPIYLLAVYLIHPHLGYIVTVAAVVLFVIAYLNQQFTAVPFARSSAF